MKNVNYEEILEKVLDILKIEGVIDDIDWGLADDFEILNIFTKDKIYSFETKKDNNIKITIDTLSEED